MKRILVAILSLGLSLPTIAGSDPHSMCSPVNGKCVTNDDCCTNLCSPTSCSQGMCIGSTCLADGNSCQVDCQCCTGACVRNSVNQGICGIPTPSARQHCAGNACVSHSKGNATASRAEICCPLSQKAVCTEQGSTCNNDAAKANDCSGAYCNHWENGQILCAACCDQGVPAYCGVVKDGYDCTIKCLCGAYIECNSVLSSEQTPSSVVNIGLLTATIVSSVAFVAMTAVYVVARYRTRSPETIALMDK